MAIIEAEVVTRKVCTAKTGAVETAQPAPSKQHQENFRNPNLSQTLVAPADQGSTSPDLKQS